MAETLDIFADPICPWSYIGKAFLDRALRDLPEPPFAIRWRVFMLNPQMPPEGMDRRKYLEQKFGNKSAAATAYAPVVEHAAAAGVEINLDKITRTPSTLDAHRLIHWAGLEGRQVLVAHRLMEAYFTQGRDISDTDVLADIADGAEMDAALVRRLLLSEADRTEVVEMDASARAMGVDSSPTFVVAGRHAVPGAQPTELWQKVISELQEAQS